MKKTFSLLQMAVVIGTIVVAMTSCGDNNGPDDNNDNNGNNSNNGNEPTTAVSIKLTDVTESTATFSVTSSDPEQYFLGGYAFADYFDSKSEQQIAESQLDQIKGTGSWEELADFIVNSADKGSFTVTLEGLPPSKDLGFFVFGVNANADIVEGTFAKCMFRTKDVVAQELSFTLEVSDITGSSATVTATPSNNDAYYYLGVMQKDAYIAVGVEAYFGALVNANSAITPIEELFKKWAFQGVKSDKFYSMSSGTEYVAYAIGVNERLVPNSKPTIKEFITTADPFSAPVQAAPATVNSKHYPMVIR